MSRHVRHPNRRWPLPAEALAWAPGQALALALALALISCASGPPPPDWQLDAHAALEHAVAAYLAGDTRLTDVEFERARQAVSRTGQADLLARAALLRCAAQVASLDLSPCTGFEPYRADAAAAERAYADYLAGRAAPPDRALLPPAQQAISAPGPGGAATDAALAAIADPVSRLVAAGVLLQTGRASPVTIKLAVDTASAQGWRRPLLAWLGVQAQQADAAGAKDEAARLRRRIAWVEGQPATPAAQP